MSTTKISALAGAIAFSLAAAQAQETLDFHSCTAQIGGGFAATRGPDSHDLNNGGDFQAGGGFAATRSFALTGNFLLDEPGVSKEALPATVTVNGAPATVSGGQARFYSVTFDPELRVYARKHFNVYVLAGFGWFRRSIEYTGAATSTLTHPGDMKLESVSADSGAMNFGAGLNFGAIRGFRLYAEARYLRGLAVNRESTLIPVIFGIRW
jgi:Outer membrane protein beta-barrel domain